VLANDLKTEIKVWVVSDKPAEELQGEGERKPEGGEQRERGETSAGEGRERGERRGGRREKAEAGAEKAEAAVGGEAPSGGEAKKKGKKKAEQAENA
jgi:hypothetical protein